MMEVYQTLLHVNMAQIKDPYVWHPDVTMWSVHDKQADGYNGNLLGYFYLDLFPRPGKYGHACCVPLQAGYGHDATGTTASSAAACDASLAAAHAPCRRRQAEAHRCGRGARKLCRADTLAALAAASRRSCHVRRARTHPALHTLSCTEPSRRWHAAGSSTSLGT